jgi:hypothetical protein
MCVCLPPRDGTSAPALTLRQSCVGRSRRLVGWLHLTGHASSTEPGSGRRAASRRCTATNPGIPVLCLTFSFVAQRLQGYLCGLRPNAPYCHRMRQRLDSRGMRRRMQNRMRWLLGSVLFGALLIGMGSCSRHSERTAETEKASPEEARPGRVSASATEAEGIEETAETRPEHRLLDLVNTTGPRGPGRFLGTDRQPGR